MQSGIRKISALSGFDDQFATCGELQSFSIELKEKDGSQEPNKMPSPIHVTMVSQKEKAMEDTSKISKHVDFVVSVVRTEVEVGWK